MDCDSYSYLILAMQKEYTSSQNTDIQAAVWDSGQRWADFVVIAKVITDEQR